MSSVVLGRGGGGCWQGGTLGKALILLLSREMCSQKHPDLAGTGHKINLAAKIVTAAGNCVETDEKLTVNLLMKNPCCRNQGERAKDFMGQLQ